MRLFKINESELVAAETEAAACQHLREVTGEDIEEVVELPVETTVLSVTIDDEAPTHQNAGQIIREMQERGVEFPTIIGGVE